MSCNGGHLQLLKLYFLKKKTNFLFLSLEHKYRLFLTLYFLVPCSTLSPHHPLTTCVFQTSHLFTADTVIDGVMKIYLSC